MIWVGLFYSSFFPLLLFGGFKLVLSCSIPPYVTVPACASPLPAADCPSYVGVEGRRFRRGGTELTTLDTKKTWGSMSVLWLALLREG